jgi:hypothetical protein
MRAFASSFRVAAGWFAASSVLCSWLRFSASAASTRGTSSAVWCHTTKTNFSCARTFRSSNAVNRTRYMMSGRREALGVYIALEWSHRMFLTRQYQLHKLFFNWMEMFIFGEIETLTEQVVSLLFGRYSAPISAGTPVILRVLRRLPQYLRGNAGIVPQIRSHVFLPNPFKSIIHLSSSGNKWSWPISRYISKCLMSTLKGEMVGDDSLFPNVLRYISFALCSKINTNKWAGATNVKPISQWAEVLAKEFRNFKHRLFRVWGSHSGGFEEYYPLGYNAV